MDNKLPEEAAFQPLGVASGWDEPDIVERVLGYEKKRRTEIENCQIIVDLMQPQMTLFEQREGHNLYAVRLAVDHESSIRTTTKEADTLKEAATTIAQLRADNAKLVEGLKPFARAFGYWSNLRRPKPYSDGAKKPHGFVLTSEFEAAQATLQETGNG